MPYTILDPNALLNYLNTNPAIKNLFPTPFQQATEIGTGNLNQIFLIEDKTHKKYIVKQSLPYIRCLGHHYPLVKERIHFEITSLLKFKQIMPQHIAEIYYCDHALCLFIMAYMEGRVLRDLALAQTYATFPPTMIGHYLAHIAFKTSRFNLSQQQQAELAHQFKGNHAMVELSRDYIFTFPFIDHPSNPITPFLLASVTQLRNDLKFQQNIATLKQCFMEQAQALVHGDLHTGSIYCTHDNFFIFDSEFACIGPMSFDLGILLAHLILMRIALQAAEADPNCIAWLNMALQTIPEVFIQTFNALCQEKDPPQDPQPFSNQIIQQAFGFAGCEIARRIIGAAGVPEIRDYLAPPARLAAEKQALQIARELVTFR